MTGSDTPIKCRVYSRWFPDRPCGAPATISVRCACVHEHVWDGAVCDEHASTELHCEQCYAIDKHHCLAPMTRLGTLA